jgi:hypothetical protein
MILKNTLSLIACLIAAAPAIAGAKSKEARGGLLLIFRKQTIPAPKPQNKRPHRTRRPTTFATPSMSS